MLIEENGDDVIVRKWYAGALDQLVVVHPGTVGSLIDQHILPQLCVLQRL